MEQRRVILSSFIFMNYFYKWRRFLKKEEWWGSLVGEKKAMVEQELSCEMWMVKSFLREWAEWPSLFHPMKMKQTM